MDEPTNTPMMIPEPKPGAAAWLPIWTKAVTRPSETTFAEITDTPLATSRTAFLWVFIAGTVAALISALLTALLTAAGFERPPMPIPGMEQFQDIDTAAGPSIVGTICGAPIAGLFSVIFFAIGSGLIQWVAKLFGGMGTFDKTSYALAAISVPFSLLSSVLGPLSVIRYLGICTGLLSFAMLVYAIVLDVIAVKAVNRFGWGQAVASVLLPALAIVFFCACVVGTFVALLMPVVSEAIQQIEPGLAP